MFLRSRIVPPTPQAPREVPADESGSAGQADTTPPADAPEAPRDDR